MNDKTKKVHPTHTPEANAKRAATMARRRAENVKGVTSIPLSAIPDDKPKAKLKKVKAALPKLDGLTRERAALEIMRLTMWLAQQ